MTASQSLRAWSSDELALLDSTPLIGLATRAFDETLDRQVLIGHVRLGTEEFVRSLNGVGGAWYRRAVRTGRGAIDIDGFRVNVALIISRGREEDVDDAMRERYGDDTGTRAMTRAPARDATVQIFPLSERAARHDAD